MQQVFFVVTLLAFAYSQSHRIFRPNVKIYNERIPFTPYTQPINQKMKLSYDTYPGVTGFLLYQLEFKNNSVFALEKDIDDGEYEKKKIFYKHQDGCYAVQRYVELDDDLKINLRLPHNEEVYYSDLIAISHQNKAILLRNDYTIFEVDAEGLDEVTQLQENEVSRKFENLLNIDPFTADLPYEPGYLIEDTDQRRIYALTNQGGVSFPSNISLKSLSFQFRQEAFKKRSTIYDIHYNQYKKAIFVACGHDGVDVYNVSKGYVEFVANINATTLIFEDGVINIMDVDSDNTQNYLYILDFERGLMAVNINDLNNIFATNLWIQISRAHQFDQFGSTFMIVAETMTMQDYCVEVFLNFDTNQYYFNRFYMDDMAIFDVKMYDTFAVLIGYDAHKIVYHSIYNGFIDENLETASYFEEPDLIKVQEMIFDLSNWHIEVSMLGLSKTEFKMFNIKVHHAGIECITPNIVDKQGYVMQMNSTQCNHKKEALDDSQFSQCMITHFFALSTFDPETTQQKFKRYAEIIYVLLFVISWILIITYACCRKWSKILEFLKWKTAKLQKQESYDKFAEGPASNLDTTQNAQNISVELSQL